MATPLLAELPLGIDHDYKRRRALCSVGVCFVDLVANGLALGLSPLVLPVSRLFRASADSASRDTYTQGILLYVYFCRYAVSIVWGYAVLGPAVRRRPDRARWLMLSLMLWPAGLMCLAWAVCHRSISTTILSSVVMGIGHGPAQYVSAVLFPSWWGVDCRQHHGQAILGCCRGLGAVVWTVVFGGLTHVAGEGRVDVSIYVAALIQGAVLVIVVLPILLRTDMHAVPKGRAILATGTVGPEGAVQKEFETSSPRSASSILFDWRFPLQTFVYTSFCFVGLGIKQMMTVLYQQAAQLSYDESVMYSSASLLLFWFFMTLSPLMATPGNVFPIYVVVLALESVLYVISPISAHSQNVLLFSCCRFFSGGLFAVALINSPLLSMAIFGRASLVTVQGLQTPVLLIGGSGAVVAWVLHVHAEADPSRPESDSYNAFFYLCSVLMATSSVFVGILWRDHLRR